jgi:hypothetical protein
MPGVSYTTFFKVASRLLRYFFFAVFGFSISFILSYSLGANQVVEMLLSEVLPWLIRSAIVISCVMAAASFIESFRS